MLRVNENPGPLHSSRLELLPRRRELRADGIPIELGGRAFDVLMALIESRGAVLSKDELMSRVWPGRVVEESNLQAQISSLRKALGRHRNDIKTIAGRGYQFSGEAALIESESAPQVRPQARSLTNLPEPTSALIGREPALQELQQFVASNRLVTMTGPGGIGKTRLAQEAARNLVADFADGVWIAELGPVSDPDLVPATVAAVLGLGSGHDALSISDIATELRTKSMLLVLDNCEHVIDAAAQL